MRHSQYLSAEVQRSTLPISAVDTITLAFQHTKRQLIQPFRFWQWTRLAFVGLLAGEMGSGGSCNFPTKLQYPASEWTFASSDRRMLFLTLIPRSWAA